MVRLKRRMAASKGSFSFRRTKGIGKVTGSSIESEIMSDKRPMRKPLCVLGIETSCDETGLALLEIHGEGPSPQAKILSQSLHSQVDLHKTYGGVVPELASRDHLLRIEPLLRDCLAQAKRELADLDLIAVTEGPGLAGALLVGTSFAHGLGAATGTPVISVHHLEAHLMSPLLDPKAQSLEFPFVALLVSGGHTMLLDVRGIGEVELLGETIDDAAGEAFDKSAQILGLGYPGGPEISRWAEKGAPGQFKLPRPLRGREGLDLSFSGLKTAVLTQAKKKAPLEDQDRANLAAELQQAIVDVLVDRSRRALLQTGRSRLVVAGGVSANRLLRQALAQEATDIGAVAHFPPPALCTDNGVMIAWAGGLRAWYGDTSPPGIRAQPRWDLSSLRPPKPASDPESKSRMFL